MPLEKSSGFSTTTARPVTTPGLDGVPLSTVPAGACVASSANRHPALVSSSGE